MKKIATAALLGGDMKRHAYRKDRNAVCVCGEGRAQPIHNVMSWRKSSGIGYWYGGPVNDVYYRIRCRLGGPPVWWPEFTSTDKESWTRIGDEHGKSLAQAKIMCEEHRESREDH